MIRDRWMIPAAFGGVCAALAVASFGLTKDGVVHATEKGFMIGDSQVITQMPLEEDKRYTLKMRPTSGVGLDSEVIVSAALSRDDAVVFEVEDAYWHQRGTWREGGESGTWQEQNAQTDFSFVVPESGNYDLEVTLESATSGADRLEILVAWKKPWLLTSWPLLVGALALFTLAGWAHSTRRTVMGKFLEDHVGEGSRLKIGDTEYTVIGRMEHWEVPDRVGVEFRLRTADGSERWLAIERYWREHPYLEDGEQTLVQTLIDMPLTPTQTQALESHAPKDTHVIFNGNVYGRDKENCGWGTLVTIRDGSAYQTRYEAEVFRDEMNFPRSPGDIWIECLTWRDTREVEWAVMEITDTDEVKVLELVPAEQMTHEQIFVKNAEQADPFGVAHLRGPRAHVIRTDASAANTPQQQQQSLHQPPDWNS